jgi:ribulose-5-phosphate 4-epimerase/fuculose-1-phosphate aldolase
MMKDRAARKAICKLGRRLVERGLAHGSTGNISVRSAKGYVFTPTGAALDALEPDDLSLVSAEGEHLCGLAPTKELHLHRAMYDARPSAQAIVHTHSTHCVAVTLLPRVNHDDALPALTPYYIMRVGYAPVVPYFPPGDPQLAATAGRYAAGRNVLLLAHHGPVVAGTSLEDAAMILEELEENARLYLLVAHDKYRTLDAGAVKELRERFPTENS